MGSLFLTLHMYQDMGETGMAEHKHPSSNQPGLSVQDDYESMRLLNNMCNKEGLQTIQPIHHSSSKTSLKRA